MDAYNAKEDIRDVLGEATAKHWPDRMLLSCLNRSQQRLYMKLSMTPGDWFLKSKTLTFSSSVAELPADCAKPAFLRQVANKYKIPITLNARQRDSRTIWPYADDYNNSYEAFLYKNTLEVNYTLNGNLDLWYDQRNINLHFGTAAAGGAQSLTLDSSLPRSYEDDYYNGLYLLTISGTGSGTRTLIEDYDGATGVLTTAAGTFSSDTVYGLETNLPEMAYDVWLARAAYIAATKPAATVDKDVYMMIERDLRSAELVFEDWISTRIKDTQYMVRN